MRKGLTLAALLALLGAALWVGAYAGWELHAVAARKGCVPLPVDTRPLDIRPAQPQRVRFAALGDTGTGNDGARRVADALRAVCEGDGCDFVVLLGDNFYPDGVRDGDDPKFQSAFESVYAGLQVPVLAILGNHDVKRPVITQALHSRVSPLWRMPNYEYDFRLGPARFYAINTNCAHLAWWRLEDALASEPFSGWTLVLGHHSLYSQGPHGDANWITRWLWGGAEPQVDYYVSGHNHLLEYLRIEGGHADYVVSGSGGNERTDWSDDPRASLATLRFQSRAPGFAWFELLPGRATVRFYDGAGALLHEEVRTRPGG